MSRLHADELSIEVGLVRRLVDRAFPEYADQALSRLEDSGSSNALFRLGDDKLVRVPRQPGGGASVEKEATWLPYIGAHVSVEVPRVVGVGEPDPDYPERWAITTWVPGTRPSAARPGRRGNGGPRLAEGLVRFLTELRGMDVPERARRDTALSWYRGRPLEDLDAGFRHAAAECRGLGIGLDHDEALRVWDLAVEAASTGATPESWYHGDLLVENLLLDDSGRLAAVLDFGGLGLGNPAVDLAVAWEALDADGRRVLRRALEVDDATWTASRGWALFIAVITFPYYGRSMPRRCADRLAMAHAAIAGD